MDSIAEDYAKAMHQHFRILFANWPPGQPLELGDYGIVKGSMFMRMGNISEFKIPFTTRVDQTKDPMHFESSGSVKVVFKAKGSATAGGLMNTKAGFQINFSNKKATFFNAAKCAVNSIESKAVLGKVILRLKDEGKWDKQHAIITEIVTAGSTTIIISKEKSASISIEAKSDSVKTIDLADASIGLNSTSEEGIGFNTIAKDGLQPLIGLCQIQGWTETFQPKIQSSFEMVGTSKSGKAFEVEKFPIEEVEYFGRLL